LLEDYQNLMVPWFSNSTKYALSIYHLLFTFSKILTIIFEGYFLVKILAYLN